MSVVEKKPNLGLVELGQKIVNIDLIEIKDKVPVAKTEHLDAYNEADAIAIDEIIKNVLDIDIVIEEISKRKKIKNNFIEWRRSWTSPITAVVREFTPKETRMDENIDRLVAQKEKMLETTYKVAEESIRAEFKRLQSENDNIVPNMTVFDSFVEAQRKVKGMLPNDKGVLGKASLEKIEKEFEKHVAPIREMKALEELKAKEQKQFEMYLENVDTSSDNIDKLEASIITLEKFKAQIADGELYSSITDQCTRSIDNKIGLAKGSINALKALEAQRKAEDEAKQATAKVEELQDADDEIITELNNIENGLSLIDNDKAMLEEKLARLRELFPVMKYADTQTLAKEVADKIKEMIGQFKDTTEDAKAVSETFTVHGTGEDMKALVRFIKDRGMRYE